MSVKQKLKSRRVRRRFTKELKQEAVRGNGLSATVSKRLGLSGTNILDQWRKSWIGRGDGSDRRSGWFRGDSGVRCDGCQPFGVLRLVRRNSGSTLLWGLMFFRFGVPAKFSRATSHPRSVRRRGRNRPGGWRRCRSVSSGRYRAFRRSSRRSLRACAANQGRSRHRDRSCR